MSLKHKIVSAAVFMGLLSLFGCGGGGGGSTPVASSTISGTAAAGAPIIGSVTIKDSTTPTPQTKTVPISADGKYTVDVAGLKAPYMVRADGYVGGNEYHLYSAGTSADVGGTINVTPLTDLILANIAGSVAKTYFDGNNFSGLTATQLATQSNALKAKLLPILTAIGVDGSIDLLRASFSTNHTGLDAALDVLKVTTDPTTGIATIKNIINNEQITSNLSTGSYSGTLTGTGVATGVTDIQAISAGFNQFSALFASSLPSITNPTLLALFDSATFVQGGQNLTSFLSQLVTDQGMIGISFTNISIQSFDAASGKAVVAFTVMKNGMSENDAPESWNMIKKAGKWYLQGDLRIADVGIKSRAEYRPSDMSQTITSGLNINIEDRGGRGITSAVVTGKGLPAQGLRLVNQINYSWFVIEGYNSGNMYYMTDAQINTIADTGEIYTVNLYIGSSLVQSYPIKLKKRPILLSSLSVASFPAITSPTAAQLRSFVGGTGTVSWTLPAGLTNNWLDIQISDNSGNSARSEYALAPTDTSKTIILNAVTATNQAFTPTNRWLWLGARDAYGREIGIGLW